MSRSCLKLGFGCSSAPGSLTWNQYIPGHIPCGVGQFIVSVDGSSTSNSPFSSVLTVVIRRPPRVGSRS